MLAPIVRRSSLRPLHRSSLHLLSAAILGAFCAACSSAPAPDPVDPVKAETTPAAARVIAPETSSPTTAEPAPSAIPATTATAAPTATPTAAPTAAPTATASASAAPSKPPGRSYVACGCGCCGGVAPAQSVCIDRSKGETIDKIIARDQAARKRPGCAVVGCSLGTEYKECD